MQVSTAVALIKNLEYKPGWSFHAYDHSNRFEGGVRLDIRYECRRSEREFAPDYNVTIEARAAFALQVRDGWDETDLYRAVLEKVLDVEQHEAREFFRVKDTWWAPFHPHRIDGMERWGTPTTDLMFGVV